MLTLLLFVVDQRGVRSQYKLKFGYDDRAGSSWVKAESTELAWSRPVDVELPVLEEPAPAIPSEFVGQVGVRQEFDGEIVYASHVGESQYGPTYRTVVKVGNDTVIYWGLLEQIDYRGWIKFVATVKNQRL